MHHRADANRRDNSEDDQKYDFGYSTQEDYEGPDSSIAEKRTSSKIQSHLKQLKHKLYTIDGLADTLPEQVDKKHFQRAAEVYPVSVQQVLLLTKSNFEHLQKDHLGAEFELKEFLIKAKEYPLLYVNFLDKFDERSRQILNLVLYKNLEKVAFKASDSHKNRDKIDPELIDQVKEEMIGLQNELASRIEEVESCTSLNHQLIETVEGLKVSLKNILQYKLHFAEWIEVVMLSFTEMFRSFPHLLELGESEAQSLNEHIKTVIKLAEHFEAFSLKTWEDFETSQHFMSDMENKNKRLSMGIDTLRQNRKLYKAAISFLLSLDLKSRPTSSKASPHRNFSGLKDFQYA
jgi:hypothetical protein